MNRKEIRALACKAVNKAEDDELYVFDVEATLIQVHNEAVEAFAEELRNWNLYGRMEIASEIEQRLHIEDKV